MSSRGGSGEPNPPLSVMNAQTCDWYVRVSLTRCLQVLNFYFLESVAYLALWSDMFVIWFKVEVSWCLRYFPAHLLE